MLYSWDSPFMGPWQKAEKTSVLSFTISQVRATELLQKTTSCSDYKTLKTSQTHKMQYLD